MNQPDRLAELAVAPITSGMIVGLGTGRAAARAVEALGRRVRAEGLRIEGVATSLQTEAQARALGIILRPLEGVARVDLLFDGADEVDPDLRMIKGRGGAMTRERIVAHAAARRIYLVQKAKLVAHLGQGAPVPVEILPIAMGLVRAAIERRGWTAELRASAGQPVLTDNRNPILDVRLPARTDIQGVAQALDALPGVVDHGVFLSEADEVLVEDEAGEVSRLARRSVA